jgi:ribosomal protein L7/L12
MIYCPKCGISTEQCDGEGNAILSCSSCGVFWRDFLELMANNALWPDIVSRDKHEIICPKCGYERFPSDEATPRTACPNCKAQYLKSFVELPPAEPADERSIRSAGTMALPNDAQATNPRPKSEVFTLAMAGKTVDAIKLYRSETGAGLKEAKDYVDSICKGANEATIDISKSQQDVSTAKSNLQVDARNWRVQLFKDGKPIESRLQRMFETHGPFVIDKYRLDRLVSAEIVRDASTVTTQSKSEGEASTKTGSLAGRVVAGAVIAGPVGAIIGGGSARTTSNTITTSTQALEVNIYMSLLFKGETAPLAIQVFAESSFQQVLASVGQKEWSQSELENAEDEHKSWLFNKSMQEAKKKYLNAEAAPVLWGVFVSTAIPAVYIANSFLLSVAGIVAAFILAFAAWSYSYGQMERLYDKNTISAARFKGLGSKLRLVIGAMLVIWSSVYLLNKSDTDDRTRSLETTKPASAVSSTNDADETRRRLQRDQLRRERDALQPTIGQMCQQGNNDACKQYREWEETRRY